MVLVLDVGGVMAVALEVGLMWWCSWNWRPVMAVEVGGEGEDCYH